MRKIVFFIPLLTISVYANFLTDAGNSLKHSTSSSGNFNIHNIGSVKGVFNSNNIRGILDKYGGSYLNQAVSLGKNSILNNTQLGKYFKSHAKWASGTMKLCYEYRPSSNNVSGDICSMFSNTSVDPCSALPDRIGDYYKKSSNSLKFNIPINDFCHKIAGKTIDQPLKKTIAQLGVSGKAKSDVKGSVFNDDKNHYKKKIQDRITKITDVFNTKETNSDTKTQKTVKELIKSGHGAVVIQKIKQIANQTKTISKNDTKLMNNPKIIFKDYTEYTADTEAAATANYESEKQLLDFQPLLKLANEQFISFNTEHKTLTDKMEWVDAEVEKRRKSLIVYANKKADEEITFELPRKLGYYHAFFNKDLVLNTVKDENFDNDGKINILNAQIRTQQYEEKRIKLKWAEFVDKKCNELYVSLKKIAIASEVFPKDIAMQEINQLLGDQNTTN